MKPRLLLLAPVLCIVILAHVIAYTPSEPFYNNDETRHVMTGVFIRDTISSLPLTNPHEFAVQYYRQYPALAIPLYPPLFYVVEGAAMLLLGTSIVTAKSVILVFLGVACAFLFLLVEGTHGQPTAALATILFAFSPLVFQLSRQVMLEIPTIAFILAATYYFLRYLDLQRRRYLAFATLAAVAAALTRFSGVLLIPFFIMLLVVRKEMRFLRRGEVAVAACVAALIVTPVYALTWTMVGSLHLKQVTQGLGTPTLSLLQRMTDYPRMLPSQVGWFVLVPSMAGFAGSLARSQDRRNLPYLALAASVYMTFSLAAIHDSRFVVYWIPAFTLFAADVVMCLAKLVRSPAVGLLLGGGILVATAWTALREPRSYVEGYRSAARYVIDHTKGSGYCLFDGGLNGNFIYQMRTQDPKRRISVLRGDRELYTVRLQPSMEYKEKLATDEAVLQAIAKRAPEFIVVEDPPAFDFSTPAGKRLRRLLRTHPERFELSTIVPVRTNRPEMHGASLYVYRNLV